MRTQDMINRIKAELGVNIHRVRVFHYVRADVLPDTRNKKSNGYRVWGEKDYARLKFAVLCSEVGIGTDIIGDAIRFQDFKQVSQLLEEKKKLYSMLNKLIISNS
jgi:DNA-binding transcriptional MerR regulator